MKTFLKLFCILALLTSASFAVDEALKMRAVQAQMHKLYADALSTFVPTTNGPTRKAEWSFTVHADGTPGPITSSGDWARNFLRVQHGDTVIVHSHPFGTDARPSQCDTAIAVKLGIPNYGELRFEITRLVSGSSTALKGELLPFSDWRWGRSPKNASQHCRTLASILAM